jgi:DNA-binding NarL/FixJ family response regulator
MVVARSGDPAGSTFYLRVPDPAVDFIPIMRQVRENYARAAAMIGEARIVLCLGSRPLLSFVVGVAPKPERITGAATTEAEGLALVNALRPDLLIVSDQLEEGCGVALVVAVKRLHPSIRTFLLVGGNHRPGRIQKAISAHCDAVVLESRIGDGSELTAIRTVCEGGTYVDGHFNRPGSQPCLSRRETDVLVRIARGDSNAQIGSHLFVSIDTVKSHIRNLLVKLQARDRAHAVAIGLRLGLID